jgi:pimeloyl-ACP methyl ester carboxylesterase
MLFNMMGLFRFAMKAAWPFICSQPEFPEMMDRDLSRTTVESFLLSIASLRRTDLRPMLDNISVPVMGMYGDRDIIVHPMQWKPLADGVQLNRTERFPKAGHFIMLDEPDPFMQKLKSFLDDFDQMGNGLVERNRNTQPFCLSHHSPIDRINLCSSPEVNILSH